MQVIKQSVERIPTPYEALHQDSYGTIEISHISSEGDTRWKGIRRRYHTLEKIKDEFVEKYDNENIYFSMNRFKVTSRRQENLLEITSLWSDIDYYKTDYTKEQVIGQIEIMIEDREIPRPTFIVDSGRGIYLIWKIQRVPKEALMRWKRIMEYFQEKLEYLGADARCIEPSRILRMNGSIHQGTKKVVSTIEYTGNIYTLHNLAKEFSYALPYSKPNVTTKTKRTKTYKPYYHNRNVLYLQNQYKVYQARIQDLSKLAELREYNVRGTRELMYFWFGIGNIVPQKTKI